MPRTKKISTINFPETGNIFADVLDSVSTLVYGDQTTKRLYRSTQIKAHRHKRLSIVQLLNLSRCRQLELVKYRPSLVKAI